MYNITLNLTPNRKFINFNQKYIEKSIRKLGYFRYLDTNKFTMYKNDDDDMLRIRNDGSIYYKVKTDTLANDNIITILENSFKIIESLQYEYNNLLNLDKLYVYWPDNFDARKIPNLIPNYSITTDKISNSNFSSLIKREHKSNLLYN